MHWTTEMFSFSVRMRGTLTTNLFQYKLIPIQTYSNTNLFQYKLIPIKTYSNTNLSHISNTDLIFGFFMQVP